MGLFAWLLVFVTKTDIILDIADQSTQEIFSQMSFLLAGSTRSNTTTYDIINQTMVLKILGIDSVFELRHPQQ